jgi:uncharacterized membrane protein YedE/YeeE
MRRAAFAAIAGIVFGAGLTISQMSNPEKVLAFLDVSESWDPSLLVVMASGLAVALAGFRLVLRRPMPVADEVFHLPTRTDLDARLISGAVIFGVGWGIAGFCPGPVIASLPFGATEPWLMLVSMATGFWLKLRLMPG